MATNNYAPGSSFSETAKKQGWGMEDIGSGFRSNLKSMGQDPSRYQLDTAIQQMEQHPAAMEKMRTDAYRRGRGAEWDANAPTSVHSTYGTPEQMANQLADMRAYRSALDDPNNPLSMQGYDTQATQATQASRPTGVLQGGPPAGYIPGAPMAGRPVAGATPIPSVPGVPTAPVAGDTRPPGTPAPGVLEGTPAPASGLEYVDPERSTVAGQLQTLLGSESPYIQQARLGAQRQAASRGMLSSSMAAGAGEAAAIKAGLPIAEQDAAAYALAQGREQEGDITGRLEEAGYRAGERLSAQESGQARERDKQAQIATTGDIILQGDIKEKLADAGYANDAELLAAVQAGDKDAIRLQGEINTARDTYGATATKELEALKATNLQELTRIGIDAQTANVYTQILGSLTTNALGSVNSLLNNIDITDVAGAMDVIKGFLGSTSIGRSIYAPDLDLTGAGTTPPPVAPQ